MSVDLFHPGPRTVECHNYDDDDAGHHEVRSGVHVQKVEEIRDQSHNYDADDGADDGAATAGEQCASHDYGGNGTQLIPVGELDPRC